MSYCPPVFILCLVFKWSHFSHILIISANIEQYVSIKKCALPVKLSKAQEVKL